MRIAAWVLACIVLASSAASLATDVERIEKKLMIAIDDGTEDGRVFIDLDESDAAIDLDDLQVGESRSIIDENGRNVLVTRTDTGLELNVDGRIIDLPGLDSAPHVMGSNDSVDVDIDVTRSVRVGDDIDSDHIMVISNGALDEAARDSIRSILSSSGHAEEVIFIDREGLHEDIVDTGNAAQGATTERRIKIISKQIRATN